MAKSETRGSGPGALQALNIALGTWLLAAPYFLQFTLWGDARITAALFGPLILGTAILRLTLPAEVRWVAWINAVMGVWVAVSPFVLGYTANSAATINNAVVGALVALISAADALRR